MTKELMLEHLKLAAKILDRSRWEGDDQHGGLESGACIWCGNNHRKGCVPGCDLDQLMKWFAEYKTTYRVDLLKD